MTDKPVVRLRERLKTLEVAGIRETLKAIEVAALHLTEVNGTHGYDDAPATLVRNLHEVLRDALCTALGVNMFAIDPVLYTRELTRAKQGDFQTVHFQVALTVPRDQVEKAMSVLLDQIHDGMHGAHGIEDDDMFEITPAGYDDNRQEWDEDLGFQEVG